MTQQDNGQPQFVSLIPNLMGGEGHIIPYHEAVCQAVQTLGWEHQALIPAISPQTPKIDHLPCHWQPCLLPTDLEAEGSAIAKLGRLTEAIKLGIARALCEVNAEFRPALKKQGLLRRDPRVV